MVEIPDSVIITSRCSIWWEYYNY